MLAHLTEFELPLGLLLFLAGFAAGILASFVYQRHRR